MAQGFTEDTPRASELVYGKSKLSVAPENAYEPIAVGDNDPRLNQLGSGLSSYFTGQAIAVWTGTGLIFDVIYPNYYLNGVFYPGGIDQITLPIADPTFPRFDAIIVDVSGANFIEGVASADPALPTVDPLTQLVVTYVSVLAGATTPDGVFEEVVYNENTEWTTATNNGTVNFTSTGGSFIGTNAIESNSFSTGHYLRFTDSVLNSISSFSVIRFYLRLKGTFGPTTYFRVQLWNNTTEISNSIPITEAGPYNFDPTDTTGYQVITIPVSVFTLYSSQFNRVELQFNGTTGDGFFVDYFVFQGGVGGGSPLPNFFGTFVDDLGNTVTPESPNDILTLKGGTLKTGPKEITFSGGLSAETAAGTDTYTATITGVTAYTLHDIYEIIFTNANTGSSTININSLGAKTLKKAVSTNLVAADIGAGQSFIIVYDGTNFQVIGIGGGGHVIENSGTPLTERDNINVTNGLTASDNTPDTDIKLGGALIEDTTVLGGGFDLILGTAGNRLVDFEINTTDRLTYNSSGNNVILMGKNITYTPGGGTNDNNFITGIGHNITSPGGGNIRWLFVSAEDATITNNSTGVIHDSMVHGGFSNTVINGAGKNMYNTNIVGGALNTVDNTGGPITSFQFITGRRNEISGGGNYGIVMGMRGKVDGVGGVVFGLPLTNEVTDPFILSSGIHAFNLSANNSSQTVGHGALGNYGAILGGYNHNIPADSHGVGIIGGNTIKARAASSNIVYIPSLNLQSIAGDYATPGDGDVWYNSSTNEFRVRVNGVTYTLTTGGGAPGSGVTKVGTPVDNQVGVWTGDGTIEGDVDLTFDTTTNTLATGIVTVSDEVYGAGWNASLQVPTKNAVYDKIESISAGVYDLGNLSGSVSIDLSLGRNFKCVFTANVTSFTFTNETLGAVYYLDVTRDITNYTIAFTAAKFRFPQGLAPELTNPTQNGTSPAKAIDTLVFKCGVAGRLDVVITNDLQGN